MNISCCKDLCMVSRYLSLWPWPSLELAIVVDICVSLTHLVKLVLATIWDYNDASYKISSQGWDEGPGSYSATHSENFIVRMAWTEFLHIFTLSGKIPDELNTDLQLNCLNSYRAPRITKLSLDNKEENRNKVDDGAKSSSVLAWQCGVAYMEPFRSSRFIL